MLLNNLLLFLGGLSVFLLGVRFMIDYSSNLCVGRVEKSLKKCSNSTTKAVFCGVGLSCVAQSSVAINATLVGLVDNKTLSVKQATAIIVGTNIGTTITTQIISLSGTNFDITPFACLISFIGIIMSFKRGKIKDFGYFFIGFGLIFIGLKLISQRVDYFSTLKFFQSIFKTKNPILLILYGILVPALTQSSSSLMGVMVCLSSQNLINFSQIAYLVLGANVGSCFGVILSSSDKGEFAKTTAIFNLLINIFGLICFFPLIFLGGSWMESILGYMSNYPQRKVANFHTIYNILSGIAVLPLLNFFIKLSKGFLVIVSNKKSKTIDKGKIML